MPIDFQAIPSPFFVMEEERLRQNLTLLREVREQSGTTILVAFKGFAMWSVFPILREYGFHHAASSSLWESQLAMDKLGGQAHVFSPVFPDSEFDEHLRYISHISFNSLAQAAKFLPKLAARGSRISAGLRVNPEYSQVATAIYDACAPGSRLGEIADHLPDKLPPGIDGLHIHSLCESGAEHLQNLLQAVENRFARFLPHLKWLNLGGGHYITKKGYRVDLLISILKDFQNRHPNIELIIEPGTAFAYDSGFLVSTIHDIVENHGIRTAMLDVSFAAHMPDVLEYPYQPDILGSVKEGPNTFRYRMGGNSCLAGDFFGDWHFPKPLSSGDKIIFTDMMHYTMVKTTTFNGVTHPSIGIWTRDDHFQLVRRFGYEDFLNRLS
jgi:carboxynorspermidine decarboxylase